MVLKTSFTPFFALRALIPFDSISFLRVVLLTLEGLFVNSFFGPGVVGFLLANYAPSFSFFTLLSFQCGAQNFGAPMSSIAARMSGCHRFPRQR
jgi:hypothetical protein